MYFLMDLPCNEGTRDDLLKFKRRFQPDDIRKRSQGFWILSRKPLFFYRFVLRLLFSSLHLSLSFLCLFFLSLLQALVNTNSFCQGICGCVWIETEAWEHWACLLLIEYAWSRLPGAVGDEKRMKMLMFVDLMWIVEDLLNELTQPTTVHRRKNELL